MATVLPSTKPEVQKPAAPDAHRWRFTLEQYYRMGELGILGDKRTELIGGDIYTVPIGPEHCYTVDISGDYLKQLFRGTGRCVRIEKPLQIGESMPQPDLAVVAGKPSDYRKNHPTTALLVIEVSDTTLEFDRTVKASLYASANIPEYWIVNLVEGLLEVYREPAPMEGTPFNAHYKSVRRYTQEETLSPLFDPGIQVPVKSLFESED